MIRIVVPYTKEVLDSIIYEYQEFFCPAQFIFIFLALFTLFLIWRKVNKYNTIVVSILAFFWIWIAAIYEMKYYSSINWFGFYIALFFIFQVLLLFWFTIFKKELVFKKNQYSLSLLFILILCYPLFQFFSGTTYFEVSIIGMLPDITVVFSLILLFMNTKKRILTLFIIPSLWIAFSLYWNYLLLFN